MGSTEEQQMATVLESIAEHDLDHEVLDAETLAKRFPQYRLEDGDAVVLDRRAGFIRPELTIQTAARRAEQLGAVIHRYTAVREIVPVANGVEIRTDSGSERFDTAVVTPGPWVNDLLPDLPWEVEIRRLISAWFVPTTDAWFGEERPAFIRTSPTHCYGLPSPDGISVKLGLSQALHRPAGDPNQLDRTVQPEELEIYSELIGRYLPDLHPDPTRLSVYMEGYTKSSRPLVGPLPGTGNENVILLAGFSGHGFKLSPAFGDIAADLALNGSSPQPIDFISTARPHRGLSCPDQPPAHPTRRTTWPVGDVSPSSVPARWAARPPGGWRPGVPRSSATTGSLPAMTAAPRAVRPGSSAACRPTMAAMCRSSGTPTPSGSSCRRRPGGSCAA